MRTLKFIVNRQVLTPDPNCDFSGLVPGTSGYIQAEFSFSSDWDNRKKVVGFWNITEEREYEPQKLENDICMIPVEALAKRRFRMQVFGRQDAYGVVTTNKITITQNGGKT